MIRRFLEWRQRRREWYRSRDAAWEPALVESPDGLTPFIRAAQSSLEAKVDGLVFEIAGESVKYLVGTIPRTQTMIYLGGDGATIKAGRKELFWSEWYDYETPGALIDEIVARVEALGRT